jgi:hypothetical protein
VTRKRRVGRTAMRFDPSAFIGGDGWSYAALDDTPIFDSLAEAQAAWEVCRVATWSWWLEHHGRPPCWPMLPPMGAQAHDDLEDNAWSITRASTVEEVLAAVAADLAAVADFTRRRPDAAASIDVALAVLVEDLVTYRSLTEAFGADYDGRTHAHFALRYRVTS